MSRIVIPFDETYLGGIPGWLLVVIIWMIGFIGFGYQLYYAIRLITIGSPDNRFGDWKARMKEWFSGWLGQKKVLQDRVVGTMHVMIFWGFLCLSSDMFDLSSGGRFKHMLLIIHLAGPWDLMVDIGYFVAGLGAAAALYRRVVIRPAKIKPSLEGNLILLTILTIVLTAFVIETGDRPHKVFEPFGYLTQSMLSGTSDAVYSDIVTMSFWVHMLCLSGFLIAIPASKHMHLVMALPNVVFHDMEPMAKMHPLSVDDEGKAVPLEDLDLETFGVATYDQFSWRQLIDGWACTTCYRCQDVCPAYESGKVLNPMQIVHDVRDYANEHRTTLLAGEQPEETIIARFDPAAIWACTTCHACVDACPVYIEHVPKLTETRRHLMMEAMEYPEELQLTMDNLEVNSNPYGFGAHERGDWAADLDVKVGEPAEYIYFAGCSASFDEKNKQVARSTIQLLKEAGLDVGILGMQEGCSGDPARRSGNEYLFQMLAETNLMTFDELGVKRIVASCPHCFHTLGKEYKDYGGEDIEVFHHSQILATLQEEGKLPSVGYDDDIAYHDPCYLGRIGGEFDAPRSVLNDQVVELERNQQDSFCCGAGGAQMWMEEDADKRVNEIRAQEAEATGCGTLAVGCPFCSTMLQDGLKTIGSDMEVKDIAELMWDQMQAQLAAAKKE